jgi:hypothetical protein
VTETPITVTESTQSKVKKSKVDNNINTSVADATLDSSSSKKEYTITHQIRLFIEEKEPGYYWGAKDGKGAKELAYKLRCGFLAQRKRNPTDADIIDSLKVLLKEANQLPSYYNFESVSKLNQMYNAITAKIREKKSGIKNGVEHTRSKMEITGR